MTDLSTPRKSRSGVAFILEALALLVFLAACLAVLMQLFADSYLEGTSSKVEAEAIQIAANTAERFAADPAALEEFSVEGDFFVYSPVEAEQRESGELYSATIMVFDVGNASGRHRYASAEPSVSVDVDREGAPAGPAIEGVPLDYASLDQIVAEAPLIYQLETARYVNEGV